MSVQWPTFTNNSMDESVKPSSLSVLSARSKDAIFGMVLIMGI